MTKKKVSYSTSNNFELNVIDYDDNEKYKIYKRTFYGIRRQCRVFCSIFSSLLHELLTLFVQSSTLEFPQNVYSLYTERKTFCAIQKSNKKSHEIVLRNYSGNSELMQSLCSMMTMIIEWKLLSPKVKTS